MIAVHSSVAAAARAVGLKDSSGIKVAKDRPARSAAGYHWRTVRQVDEPGEVWRPLAECDGVALNTTPYSVSSLGQVRSDTLQRRMAPVNREGYQVVGLYTAAGLRRSFLVHRLVAAAFLGKFEGERKVVNHIDRDRANNRLSNLEWATQTENMQKGSGKSTAVGR